MNILHISPYVPSVHASHAGGVCMGKELETLDEANGDIVDLCINPKKGYDLLKNSSFNFKGVLIQPGAESKEIKELLEEKGIPYLEGCALVGLRLYK